MRVWRLGRTSQVRKVEERTRKGPQAVLQACSKQGLVCRFLPRRYLLRCILTSREPK